MRPTYAPSIVKEVGLSGAKPVNVSMRSTCPSGSVPIRRLTKEDMIRSRFSKPANTNAPRDDYTRTHVSCTFESLHYVMCIV